MNGYGRMGMAATGLLLSLVLLVAGCTPAREGQSAVPAEPEPVGAGEQRGAEADEAELEALAERYLLDQVVGAGVTAREWQDPEEIAPDNLVYFYLYCYGRNPDRQPLGEGVPAEELEPFVQEYFAVSVEHIREYEHYDAEAGVYLVDGIGGAGTIKLEGFREAGGLVELTYAIYTPDASESYAWGGRLTIQEEGEAFRYLSNVRWIDPEDYALTLKGEHFLWQTTTRPLSQTAYRDFVESDGRLMVSFLGEEGWVVSEVDLETEDTMRMIHLPTQDGYALLRMGGSIWDGFHYTLYQEAYVTLCSASLFGDNEDIPLPEAVQPVQRDLRYYPCPYDYDGAAWAWAGEDGLYLLDAGGNERRLAANGDIGSLLPEIGGNGYTGLAYSSPRFMLESSRIACQVYSAGAEEPVGVAVFDTVSGMLDSALTYLLPALPRYPIADRYIATTNTDNLQLLDVLTGEVKALPFIPAFDSWDYEALLVSGYDRDSRDSYNNFTLTLHTFDDLDAAVDPLLWSEGDQGFEVAGVTEHYVMVRSRNANAFWLAAAKYRD